MIVASKRRALLSGVLSRTFKANSAIRLLSAGAIFIACCGASGNGTRSTSPTARLKRGVVTATQNPLVAEYSIKVREPAQVSVEFGPNKHYGFRTATQSVPTAGGIANILVAGMRASTKYHMRAIVTYANGAIHHGADRKFITGPLPSNVPQFAVFNANGLTPDPGVVLFSLFGGGSLMQAVATDLKGHIIWYYPFDDDSGVLEPLPIKLLSNGDMLLVVACGNGIDPCPSGAANLIREIDLAGNTVWQLTASQLQNELDAAGYDMTITQITHDAQMLPNGHVILVVVDQKAFTDLNGTSGTTVVDGGGLIDLDQNRQPVWVWDAFDDLDVSREGFEFPDWIHPNAVLYSPDDGNLILSSRSQSWLIKIDYENGDGTGNVIWRLGYQGDFALTNGGPPDWFYGQHYPIILSPNSTGVFELGLFDDGNSRVMNTSGATCGSTDQPACYSTVPIYQIDEGSDTATLEWRDTLPFFAPALGTMQLLSNGDVWFDAGVINGQSGGFASEVTQDSEPSTVLQIGTQNEDIYRAVHMPSLYPGVQWPSR